MADDRIFPPYIRRAEEQQIRDEVGLVQRDGSSRAVLLYGDGGVGKTQMLRELAQAGRKEDSDVAWLEPIDIDDSQYWLLSSLEQRIIDQLDPDRHYFEPYERYLRRLPGQTLDRLDRDTVLSHLGTVKQEFISCYKRFATVTGKTIVVVFDTVEVVRGLSLMYTLAEWMKSLPATLFVLSGRPMRDGTEADPVRLELTEGRDGLPVTTIPLGEFTWEAAHEYLGQSQAANALTDEEKTTLVLLTRGYPLWLAFTITYLERSGVPEEATSRSRAELEGNMPYGGPMTKDGEAWYAGYKRRLVGPYRETDFQHEAITRLAVVRQNISRAVWDRLMADLALPEGMTLADEWDRLREIPWIRARSSGRYVTLHDAVAEEISLRLVPLKYGSWEWRHDRWRDAAAIYADLSRDLEAELAREQERLNLRWQELDESSRRMLQGRSHADPSEVQGNPIIEAAAHLDGRRRELDELRTISLHYALLSSPTDGAMRFHELFEEARQEKDPLPAERLAVEIQQFLPTSKESPPKDAVGQVIKDIRKWLKEDGADVYEQIVQSLADYQIDTEQPQAANMTLGDLHERATDPAVRFELNVLKGNALMRLPDESANAEQYLSRAQAVADAMTSDDALLFRARANKEFGFYYRQRGKWRQANDSYAKAFRLISEQLAMSSEDKYEKEFASIERNWAYVNGIAGDFTQATNLIESAIAIYHRFEMYNDEAAARCVKGEVHRYGWQFTLAWRSFIDAERMLLAQQNRTWLGIVYQEQAMCLFQAARKEIPVDPGHDPDVEAQRLIRQALTICREQNLRSYPSALNRAARIFGADDVDAGLDYARQGIDWSLRLSDGWRWIACLVEYVNLSYHGWVKTNAERYRQGIRDIEDDVNRAAAETDFKDLSGKWHLLQGHLKIRDWMAANDAALLDGAMENYRTGFKLMAETYVGSSSGFAIGNEFERFKDLFRELPEELRAEWLAEFRRAWSPPETASTVLLARLQELRQERTDPNGLTVRREEGT